MCFVKRDFGNVVKRLEKSNVWIYKIFEKRTRIKIIQKIFKGFQYPPLIAVTSE